MTAFDGPITRISNAFTKWIRDPFAFAGLALLSLLCVRRYAPILLVLIVVLIELTYIWVYHYDDGGLALRYMLDASDFMIFYAENHGFSKIIGCIPALRRLSWRRRRRFKRLAQFWISILVIGYGAIQSLRWYGFGVLIWVLTVETIAIGSQQILLAFAMELRPGIEPPSLLNLRHEPWWAAYFILQYLACLRPTTLDMTSISLTSCWAHLLINTTFCLYVSRPQSSRSPHMVAKTEIIRHFYDKNAKPYYCTICKTILARRLGMLDSEDPIRNADHHFRRSSLYEAARRGCRICVVVWQSWLRTPISVPALVGFWQPVTSYTWSDDGQYLEVSSNLAGWLFVKPYKITFEILDMQLNTLQWDMINRNIGEYTWSPRSIEIAKKWLSECKDKHRQCHSLLRSDSYVPTRLIKVTQHARGLRLCLCPTVPGTENLQYITLSHCWGNIGDGKLDGENYDAYLSDIPLGSLPLNFRHAAQITADLGFHYIWIDSLCIVQGFKSDWDVEAPKMRAVYASSVCNIAATDASNSAQGLIFRRDPTGILPAICRKDGSAYITNNTDSFDHPLYRRAWVMQELLLAPRTLHFGRAQVYWSCNKSNASEMYPNNSVFRSVRHVDHHPAMALAVFYGTNEATILNAKLLEVRFKTMAFYRNCDGQLDIDRFPSSSVETTSLSSSGHWSSIPSLAHRMRVHEHVTKMSDSSHPFNYWALLVEFYTEMNITISADRPVALFGIVLLLAPYLGKYLGGLWQIFLPMELLWETSITSYRPKNYQAPSWSWLSVEGPISYIRCYRLALGQTFMVTVVDVQITYDDNNSIAASPPGWLRLRGKLVKAYWDGQAYRYKHRADGQPIIRQLYEIGSSQDPGAAEHYILDENNETSPRIYFDEFQDRYHLDDDVYLLAVRRGVWESDPETCEAVDGLVLRQHETSEDFVRVGVFTDVCRQPLPPFFDWLTESEITIL